MSTPLQTTSSTNSSQTTWHQSYVANMLNMIARSLVAASHIDPVIKDELSTFESGFCFAMTVFGQDMGFVLQLDKNHELSLGNLKEQRPDLHICFKHIQHAFLVLSFQESTAQAFAHDRMVVNGDLSHAICLVRCLNRLESLILPKFIAKRAVKLYPAQLSLGKKLSLGGRIYQKVAQSYLSTHHTR